MAIPMNSGDSAEDDVIASINTTPLVDVMMVLLIIFLITIPVVTRTVPVKLPIERNQPNQSMPHDIEIAVNKNGDIFWNRQFVSTTSLLLEKLKQASALSPQPEVHIRGDQDAHYEFIGKVVLACQRAGILKVGFITEPPMRGG